MELKNISILSCEEYEKYYDVIPKLSQLWWTKTPGFINGCVRQAKNRDDVWRNGPYCNAICGVRPVGTLKITLSDKEFWVKNKISPGSKVKYGLASWTVLDVYDDEIYALCDRVIARRRFDTSTNKWEESELKQWLENYGFAILRSYNIPISDNLEEISLLTVNEYNKYISYIPDISTKWWLRSSDHSLPRVGKGVHPSGYSDPHCFDNVAELEYSVRPAVKIKIGDAVKSLPGFSENIWGLVIESGKYTWTVLDYRPATSTILALCDSSIAKRGFDAKSRMWQSSELKKWLETDGIKKITRKEKSK